MTTRMYKPVLVGAILVAFAGTASFGQYYPQPAYQDQNYRAPQLTNLVAPIALYPDSLLSQVLVACTYPEQLLAASQWLSQASYLQGEQRLEAAQQQSWDPSVQALVAFPDVLQRLTQDPQWASQLGNAFLNNQTAVMNAVQEMRLRAQQSGRLQSTPQQTVNFANYGSERAIEIISANPEVIYVPSYDPAYIWGAPSYGYYPSLSYPSWGFGFGSGIALSGFFGGYRGGYGGVYGGGYGGGYGNRYGGWGWGSNWQDRRVTVNNDFFYRNRFSGYEGGRYSSGSTTWRHDNSRGNGFVGGGYNTGQGNRGQFEGRGNRDRQQSFNNNYRQQDTRSNQQVGPQRQLNNAVPRQSNNAALQQFGNTGSRRFNNNEGSQQFSRPQVQQQQQFTQPRSFQSVPQQQFGRSQNTEQQMSQSRSFQQQVPQQQGTRPQMTQPQYTQPQMSQPRSFQQSAPQQQGSRPTYSQPQTSQRFEQRSFGGSDRGTAQQPSRQGSSRSDQQSGFGRNQR